MCRQETLAIREIKHRARDQLISNESLPFLAKPFLSLLSRYCHQNVIKLSAEGAYWLIGNSNLGLSKNHMNSLAWQAALKDKHVYCPADQTTQSETNSEPESLRMVGNYLMFVEISEV